MSSDFDLQLDRYAQLIVNVGLNLQPGQRLLIGSPVLNCYTPMEALPLVRRVTYHAYQAGAAQVDVIWGDPELDLIRLKNAPTDTLDIASQWPVSAVKEFVDVGGAQLMIFAQDPDLFDGQDPQVVGRFQQAVARQTEPLMGFATRNTIPWAIAAVPLPAWAAKIFPALPPQEQIDRLWEMLFTICRVDTPDPVAAWKTHIQDLAERSAYLTSKAYTALHYTAPGTDLTLGLPDGHVWQSGALNSENGIPFIANLPTEEVFTMPHKDRAEGTVSATKPLYYGGALIENLRLTFQAGRVVQASATRGEELLNSLLASDEGAVRLGEVALVPHSSPISQTGLLFYNILIDENASNHLALGHAYQFSLQDGAALTEEEFAARGGNISMIHTDFMIGSGQMDIDGITASGAAEPVLRGGEWAF